MLPSNTLAEPALINSESWFLKLFSPCQLIHFSNEVVLDNVESILGGQKLVVLHDEVLHFFAHAWREKGNVDQEGRGGGASDGSKVVQRK